jgi:hypothetical protein
MSLALTTTHENSYVRRNIHPEHTPIESAGTWEYQTIRRRVPENW